MFERKEVFVGVPSKEGRLGKASFSGSETLQCASAVGRGGGRGSLQTGRMPSLTARP